MQVSVALMSKSLAQLSRRERQIMDILIERREQSAQEIQHAMPDPPSYSTVRALLARLLEKKVVSFRQEGAKYIYFPAIEESQAKASAISRLLKTFFRGSRFGAVNALLESEGNDLSDWEIHELERKIAQLKKQKRAGEPSKSEQRLGEDDNGN